MTTALFSKACLLSHRISPAFPVFQLAPSDPPAGWGAPTSTPKWLGLSACQLPAPWQPGGDRPQLEPSCGEMKNEDIFLSSESLLILPGGD